MKPNQNIRQNRPVRTNQNNNPKRTGRPQQQNNNRNSQSSSPNRQLDSYGPAGNIRGNAKQLYEKYKGLALDKRASDRIESEALDQYADHYYRMYAETAAVEAAAQVSREKERSRREQEDIERRANAKVEAKVEARVEERPVHQGQHSDGSAETQDVIKPKRPRVQRKPVHPTQSETAVPSEAAQNIDAAAPINSAVNSENSAQGENAPTVEKPVVRKPRRKKIIPDVSLDSAPKLENSSEKPSENRAVQSTEPSSEG